MLVGIYLAQCAYYYAALPETVASHFNAAGKPDGQMPKGVFMIFEVVLLFVIIGQSFLAPLMIDRLPDSMINLPNKQYWLAPERRAATIGMLRNHFEWFSAGLLAVFVALNQLVFRANLDHENFSGRAATVILGVFLTFVVVWLIILLRKFKIN